MATARTPESTQPLRVLMLAPGIGLGGADVGVIDWCASAAEANIQPYLLTTQFGQDNSRFEDAATRCVAAEHLPDRFRPADMPAHILQFIDEHQIELVHIMNSKVGFELLPHLQARVPTVVQFHNEERSGRGFPRHVASRYDQWVSAYSVVSSDMGISLERHGVAANKIYRILLGVDTDHFRSLSRADTHTRILWAGRLSYQKRPELVLEIAHALRDRGSDVRIDIAGSGELEGDLAASIHLERLGEHVMLHGDIRDLTPYYERAGIVLLTSRYEGIPRVIYEALSMERPVVTPSVGGTAELVDDTNGILLDPSAHASDYADALERLIHDPALRARLGTAGRERVVYEGSVHTMITAHRALYEMCMSEHVPVPVLASRAGVPNASTALLLTSSDDRTTHLRRADSVPDTEDVECVVGYLSELPHGDSVPLRNEAEAHTLGHATLVPLPGTLLLEDAIAFAVWRAEQGLGHALTAPTHRPLAAAEPAYIEHPLLGPGAPPAVANPRDLRVTIIVNEDDGLGQLVAQSLSTALEAGGVRVTLASDVDATTGPLGALIIVGEHPLLDPAQTEDHPTRPAWIVIGVDATDTPIMNRARQRITHCLAVLHIDAAQATRWCEDGVEAQWLPVFPPPRPDGTDCTRSTTTFLGALSAHNEQLLARAAAEHAIPSDTQFFIRDTAIAGLDPEPEARARGGVRAVLAASERLVLPEWDVDLGPSQFLLDVAEAWHIDVVRLGHAPSDAARSTVEPLGNAALFGLLERSTGRREQSIAHHGQLLAFAPALPATPPAAPETGTRHGSRDRTRKRRILERRALQRRLTPPRDDHEFETAFFDAARPTLTVVVTAHGQSEFLEECLHSVANASRALGEGGVECIVHTDGDGDAADALQQLLISTASFATLPMLCLNPGTNRGLGAARNLAVERARADRLLFLDADDLLEAHGLSLLSAALDADPSASFAYGMLRLFGHRDGIANRFPWSPERLVHGNYIGALGMVRTQKFRDLGGFNPEMNDRYGGFEDYELWLHMAERGERGAFVPSFVAAYRQADSSMIATTGLDVWSTVAALHELHPKLPWPYHLAPGTNDDALPDLERIQTISASAAQRALKRIDRKLG